MSLIERDREAIWHPYTQVKNSAPPIPIVKGEGVFLWDESGTRYIDAVSSWWVNIHGHSHPYIAQKISEQLAVLEHVIFAGFTHKPAVELAERILKMLPGKMSKLFYSDNGSTAVEVALKMALQYWHNKGFENKNKIIVLEHSYHGDTFGSMSVSERGAFTKPFSNLLFDVIQIPFPAKGVEKQTIRALESEIKKHGDKIAAFIFEPLVLGAGGMLMYSAEVLSDLMRTCKDNNVVTIADEVMTGFGRTGKLFACDHIKNEPDIICLSKGITGGTLPLGATACQQHIFDAFVSDDRNKTLFHGHSYTANPIACVAALASHDLLLSEKTLAAIERISKQHLDFSERLKKYSLAENIRCCGTIIAFDFKSTGGTSYFNSVRDELYDFFLKEGIILRPLGNTIYIMPPYCISSEELETVYASIEKKLRSR